MSTKAELELKLRNAEEELDILRAEDKPLRDRLRRVEYLNQALSQRLAAADKQIKTLIKVLGRVTK